jgi:hypothetical protein
VGGGDIENPPADEDSACNPDVAYERSSGGEQAVMEFAREANYPVVVVRPAWCTAAAARTARLFRTIKKGRFFCGDGKTLASDLHR